MPIAWGYIPCFGIYFSSPVFVHSSTKLVLISSKAETTICHFCTILVPNMIPKIQLVLLYHVQLVPLMQQTPGSQRLFCIIQREYWGWETSAIISLFYLLEINDCSPGLLSMIQCWQHKHGRIPPFISFLCNSFLLWSDNWAVPDVQAGFRKGSETRDQIANLYWIVEKGGELQKNMYFHFIDYAKAFACVDHNKLWKILKEMEISDHLTCLLRNLYAGQEATVWTGHGTWNNGQVPNWDRIRQGCISSPCVFNLYTEYIIQNARLDEEQAGIKIAGRIMNNLRYADGTTFMAEREEN